MEWKKVDRKGQVYLVSEFGDVKRPMDDGSFYYYKKTMAPDGYLHTAELSVHQWVAIAFLGHTPNKHNYVVNHIDGDRSNNHVSNLEVVTHSENIYKSRPKGTSIYPFVTYCDKISRFKVSLRAEGKPRYYGSFKNEVDAGRVAKTLAEIYRPELVKMFKI